MHRHGAPSIVAFPHAAEKLSYLRVGQKIRPTGKILMPRRPEDQARGF
jgi:hypothetical protein